MQLDQVRSERDRAETAERLVGANGEKFTTEEAKNVAEGMQTTNNILTDIRDALIKSEHGGMIKNIIQINSVWLMVLMQLMH